MFGSRFSFRVILAVALIWLFCATLVAVPPTERGNPPMPPTEELTGVLVGTIDIDRNVRGRPLGDLPSVLTDGVMPPRVELTVYRVREEGMMCEEVAIKTTTVVLRKGVAEYRMPVPTMAKVVVRARYLGEWDGLPAGFEVRVEPVDPNVHFLHTRAGVEIRHDLRIETVERPSR